MISRKLGKRRKLATIGIAVFISYLMLHVIFGRHTLPASDMYTYISFARHYAENWFYTKLPGQAHGLEIVSYSPLLFQVMALISLAPLLDFIPIYIVLMSLGATALSFVFYHLFKEISGIDHEKDYLLIPVIALSPGLLKFVLIHGSITLVFGLTFGFLSTALLYRIIHGEDVGPALIITSLLTAYIHPLSFLITALMMGTIGLLHLRATVSRAGYLAPVFLISGSVAAIGLFPMIEEILFGITQGQIPHGSRHPIKNLDKFTQFLATTYSLSILGLPLLFKEELRSFDVDILTLLFMNLGLGLITQTPHILFQGYADFLIYDRFSLIASLFLITLIGVYTLQIKKRIHHFPVRKLLLVSILILSLGSLLWANSVFLDSYTGYGNYNSERTEAAVDFLNQNGSKNYLYLAHGHPIPAAEIRYRTDIPTLDTGFYQGRKIDFLKSTGRLNRVSKKKFMEIVNHSNNLSLKYILSFEKKTSNWMEETSWKKRRLGSNVTVWINPEPVKEYRPDFGEKRLAFTVVPIIVLLISLLYLYSARFRAVLENAIMWLQSLIEGIVLSDILDEDIFK